MPNTMTIESPSEGAVGRAVVAITGTAVQLPAQVCKSITISALQAITNLAATADNVDTILIGFGAAPAWNAPSYTGIPLRPGETREFAVSNTNLIFINGLANDGITFTVQK